MEKILNKYVGINRWVGRGSYHEYLTSWRGGAMLFNHYNGYIKNMTDEELNMEMIYLLRRRDYIQIFKLGHESIYEYILFEIYHRLYGEHS